MTRMWMISPANLCRNHLCGEHNEIHKAVGNLKKHRSITGYIRNNCLEPWSFVERHDELAKEMIRRGYNHNSPLEFQWDGEHPPKNEYFYTINTESSFADLMNKCNACSSRRTAQPIVSRPSVAQGANGQKPKRRKYNGTNVSIDRFGRRTGARCVRKTRPEG